MANWENDLSQCVPHFRLHIYRGKKEERAEDFHSTLEEAVASWSKEEEGGGGGGDSDAPFVVLTTYEMILKDEMVLRGSKRTFEWSYLVVDEGHRLKNRKGKLLAAMNRIHTKHRLLLTGTPLQNELGELFSLLSFIQPKLFQDADSFNDWFNQPFENDTNKGKSALALSLSLVILVMQVCPPMYDRTS